MQCSTRHTPSSQLALAVVVMVAGTAFLLAFSPRAGAEDVDSTTSEGGDPAVASSSAPAGEGIAPLQSTPPPATEAPSSEPAEATAPEGGDETASLAAESEPAAVPAPPATTDVSAPEIDAGASVPKDAAAILDAAAGAPKDAAAIRSVDQVPSTNRVPTTDEASEMARNAGRVPAKATAPITHSTKSIVDTVDAVEGVTSVDRVHTLPDHLLQVARGALRDGDLGGLVARQGVELPTSPGDHVSAVGVDAFLPQPKPAISRTAPAGFHADQPAGDPSNSPIRYLLELAGVEPLPPMASGVSNADGGGLGWIGPGGVSIASVEKHLANFAPSDANGPQPAPGSSQGMASGNGGASFVPLAALLALLALAAPAILRRLGAVPDLRPQAPFVCALERPG